MSLHQPELYEFGPFRLEPREHVLQRSGEPVVLPPKAFDLLAVLVGRAGRLVRKEELLKEVWGETVVEEANLSYTVSLLRRALGDERGAPQYIETVATRGYRFVAPVTRIAPSAVAEAQTGLTRPGYRRAVLLVAAGVAVGGVLLLGLRWLPLPSPAVLPPARFELLPPDGASFSARPTAPNAAVSPDGGSIAFVASTAETEAALWVRDLSSVEPRMLRGTSGVSTPFWSPDGQWLAFFDRLKLRKVSKDGGPIDTLSDATAGAGGSWSRNGIILFGGPPRSDGGCAPLHSISSTPGGSVRAATHLNSEQGELCHSHPEFLNDGQSFLYTVQSTSGERSIHIASLKEGQQARRLIAADSNAVFSPAGYLLYVRDDTLVAHRFDAETWQLAGEPIRIVEGVIPAPTNRRAPFATGGSTLVYRVSSPLEEGELVWMDRQGNRVGTVGQRGRYQTLALSHDGRRLAVDAFNRYGTTSDILIFELATGNSQTVTFDPAHDRRPFWSRDGRLFFSSSRTSFFSVYQKDLTRAAPEQPLMPPGPPYYYMGRDVSPDGALVLVDAPGPNSNLAVITIKDRKLQPLLNAAASEEGGQFAPDGRWVAYSSDEMGVHEVFVQPFPPSGAKWKVSQGGGREPRWRRDGRELFYLAPDGSLVAVPVEPGEPFRIGKAETLFRARPANAHGLAGLAPGYAVNAAGDRFLLNSVVEPQRQPWHNLTVVLNWQEELKQRVHGR